MVDGAPTGDSRRFVRLAVAVNLVVLGVFKYHGFFISSMLAGACVGLGILLIFSVGSNLDPGVRPLAMGASFAIALTLVIFAGSDLFTGHTMFMSLGWLQRRAEIPPFLVAER